MLKIEPAFTDLNSYQPNDTQIKYLIELKAITLLAEKLNISYAICGGYGLDGLYGKLTRDHDDIDIIVADENLSRFIKLLEKLGYLLDEKETSENKRLAEKSRFHDYFKIYIHHKMPKDFKVEVGAVSMLEKYSEFKVEFIPEKVNAHLEKHSFKSMPIKGLKTFIEIETIRGKEQEWDQYPQYKVDNQKRLLKELNKITSLV